MRSFRIEKKGSQGRVNFLFWFIFLATAAIVFVVILYYYQSTVQAIELQL